MNGGRHSFQKYFWDGLKKQNQPGKCSFYLIYVKPVFRHIHPRTIQQVNMMLPGKTFSERIRALLNLLFWTTLFPAHHFLRKNRHERHSSQYLFYSTLPRLNFLLPHDSVMRSFNSFINWGFYPANHIQLFNDFVSNIHFSQQKIPYSAYHYYRLLQKGSPNNKSILEVGCGKGFACKYVADPFFSPQQYIGIDVNSQFIQVCKGHNLGKRYEFLEGSALTLPFSSHSFDIVLNVESSHCYPSFKTFLKEVERVLRPGGKFLFTDLRWGWGDSIKKTLEKQLNSTNLEVISFDEITENILMARKRVSKQITHADRLVFKHNQTIAAHYCLEGSRTFEMLQSGAIMYFEAILQKK